MTRTIHKDDYHLLLAFMQQVRESLDITQTELAQRLRTTQSYVSKCERGERRIDIMEFVNYCEALGVDAGVLMDAFLDHRDYRLVSEESMAAAVASLMRKSKRRQRMRAPGRSGKFPSSP
ncbi:helix-turn-helix domain-containing protein [Dyella ginsengisoli]|uniref:helix-turn-helix domain-containing protein n=1 Tax=Dyella ginsengisoli TaxID=363848 RepID=UPI0003452231|nr:helix-turn-helix transcriptional regulator [Dyella ginsengisoli]